MWDEGVRRLKSRMLEGRAQGFIRKMSETMDRARERTRGHEAKVVDLNQKVPACQQCAARKSVELGRLAPAFQSLLAADHPSTGRCRTAPERAHNPSVVSRRLETVRLPIKSYLVPDDAKRALASVVGRHAPAFVALFQALALPHGSQPIVLNLAQPLNFGPCRVWSRILVRAKMGEEG